MNPNAIINQTIVFVKETLKDAEGGHDWFHIERVYKTAQTIGKTEQANMLVVSLAALLHDIADSKFNNGDETIGPKIARTFLEKQSIDKHSIDHVVGIIANISFKGGKEPSKIDSLE